MLMDLTRPTCSADLASLQLDRQCYKPECAVYLPATLARQSSQGRILRDFSSQPSHNDTLSPVEILRQYERATAGLHLKDTDKLFVAIRKSHQQVVSCTIVRWLKETLKLAGTDASIFSVRGALTSAAAGAGITMNNIMQAADWSCESVFQRFYYHPSHDTTHGRTVLSSTSGET